MAIIGVLVIGLIIGLLARFAASSSPS